MNGTCSTWLVSHSSDGCAPTVLYLSGKQDYKKTKSVLKATRLKAEAKKNSSGFRVRLSRTSSLSVSSTVSTCLSCLGPSVLLLVCHFANHLLSICLSVCLPVWQCVSLDHFLYPRRLARLQLTAGLSGMLRWMSNCSDVMWPPASSLKIGTSVENYLRGWKIGRVLHRFQLATLCKKKT